MRTVVVTIVLSVTRAQESGRFDGGRILVGLTLGFPEPD
jgi:hypothetical protein